MFRLKLDLSRIQPLRLKQSDSQNWACDCVFRHRWTKTSVSEGQTSLSARHLGKERIKGDLRVVGMARYTEDLLSTWIEICVTTKRTGHAYK